SPSVKSTSPLRTSTVSISLASASAASGSTPWKIPLRASTSSIAHLLPARVPRHGKSMRSAAKAGVRPLPEPARALVAGSRRAGPGANPAGQRPGWRPPARLADRVARRTRPPAIRRAGPGAAVDFPWFPWSGPPRPPCDLQLISQLVPVHIPVSDPPVTLMPPEPPPALPQAAPPDPPGPATRTRSWAAEVAGLVRHRPWLVALAAAGVAFTLLLAATATARIIGGEAESSLARWHPAASPDPDAAGGAAPGTSAPVEVISVSATGDI